MSLRCRLGFHDDYIDYAAVIQSDRDGLTRADRADCLNLIADGLLDSSLATRLYCRRCNRNWFILSDPIHTLELPHCEDTARYPVMRVSLTLPDNQQIVRDMATQLYDQAAVIDEGLASNDDAETLDALLAIRLHAIEVEAQVRQAEWDIQDQYLTPSTRDSLITKRLGSALDASYALLDKLERLYHDR